MNEWKLSKRQVACAACERAFDDGEAHVSSLVLAEGALVREDRCVACWRAASPSALLWWRTRHHSDRRRALALDLESLEALFVRLEGRTEEALLELRYVLCLILLRKRRVVIDRTIRGDGREAMVVRRPRRKDSFEVAVFDLAPEAIERLGTKLREVFEGAEGIEVESPREAPGSTGNQAPCRSS